MGSFNLFAALATLAYDGPRKDYATPEFFAALKIAQDQHFDPKDMLASWAGAFGQTQFTPTNFLRYGADGDGDGKIDLWHSPADALASAARLLVGAGWQRGQPWGFEIKLPLGFNYVDADLDISKPLSYWAANGVQTVSGAALPAGGDAALYLPAGVHGPAFLVFPNFRVILKYNNAASYALAVVLLGERIAGHGGVTASWPRGERPLSMDERIRFQSELTALGFDTGNPDGVLGRRTRTALRAWQSAKGVTPDGYPTAALLALLDADAAKKTTNP
jgi:membrane-bound lytic murein transglycosylase B